jgi:hypothetical protein
MNVGELKEPGKMLQVMGKCKLHECRENVNYMNVKAGFYCI